jgi:hypothetical protein
MRRRVARSIVAATVLGAVAAASAVAQVESVAETKDAAPGGGTYRGLRRPDVAGSGAAAFLAKVKTASGNVLGIYETTAPMVGAAVVLRDDTVPVAGGRFRRFSRPAINGGGTVAWQARIAGGPFGHGIFAESAAGTIVAASDDPNPGSAGGTIDRPSRPEISDNGDVVFYARLRSASADEGLFRCVGGNGNCSPYGGTAVLEQLVVTGDTYTDSVDAASREVCELSENFDVSNWGIAFRATTAPAGGCSGAAVRGVLRMPFGGAIEAIAKDGDPADPGPSSVHFRFDGAPAINNAGDVAFLGETLNPVQEVVYHCTVAGCPVAGVTPQAFVLQGASDGGGSTVTRFKSVGISDAGDVAFHAVVRDPDKRGLGVYLARYPSTTLERLAVKKDIVVPEGELRRIERPAMSTSGHVAFRGKVKNAIVGGRFAIFVSVP